MQSNDNPTGARPCSSAAAPAFNITIITTGGTLEKVYDEAGGTLYNQHSNVPALVQTLRLPDLHVTYDHLFSKDSLHMDDADRHNVLEAVRRHHASCGAILIVHGTDTLALTGELLHREVAGLRIPVVLTGAMRPLQMRDTDAIQNVAEALLACRLLGPGVYVAMHNRVLKFPGVVKDRALLTFTREVAGTAGPAGSAGSAGTAGPAGPAQASRDSSHVK
ncbi:MAG: asparaginase [Phycisphaerales bacterium]|nr:asparaginase [Phycisphaerales bacterium]